MSEPEVASFDDVRRDEREELRQLRVSRRVHYSGDIYIGLALSGGGIRSATFNLGILQALAKLGVLRSVDYLSTVSGGGYIGSWLAAWIKRSGFDEVETALDPGWPLPSGSPVPPFRRQAPQIEFLRDYSNYLTPQLGLLGADTWAAVATFFRNLLLNLAVLISLFVAALLLPYLLAFGVSALCRYYFVQDNPVDARSVAVLALGLILGVVANRYLYANLREIWDAKGPAPGAEQSAVVEEFNILVRVVLPLLAGTLVLAVWLSAYPGLWNSRALEISRVVAGVLIALDLLGWGVVGRLRKTPWATMSRATLHWGLICHGAVSLAANWWVLGTVFSRWSNYRGMSFKVLALGIPLSLLVTLLAAALQVGLAGLLFRNQLREWTARLGGWVLIFGLVWLGIFGIAFYSPLFAMWAGAWVSGTLTVAWAVHSVSGVLSAYSSRTGKAGSGGWLDILVRTAPLVFVVGLFVLLSFGISKLMGPSISPQSSPPETAWNAHWGSGASQFSATVTPGAGGREPFASLAGRYWQSMDQKAQGNDPWVFLVACIAAFGVGVLLSLRVDVNDFSMNLFYRNRLVRCYLGASRPPWDGKDPCRRDPNRFTGFDPKDDLLLASLARERGPRPDDTCLLRIYDGPYPILNATLNLTHGERLAWQERKAESFTFTPLYCGGTQDDGAAYRPTCHFTYPDGGPFLGTAFAVSGAAVSPFLGFHSSAAAGFLLTVFNARLSEWLANPSKERWNKPGPRWGLPYILAELFGLMDTRRDYVCLSDGGHFENLGIYELVRRGCRCIIVGDASADPALTFEDLGNAIRKCRSDFGVEISINTSAIERGSGNFCSSNFAVGTIDYGEGDEEEGIIVYLKASLTGREPTDVLEYHSEYSEFPHQSTADQWFDESQFESYRRLGQFVAETAFGRSGLPRPLEDRDAFFRKLRALAG